MRVSTTALGLLLRQLQMGNRYLFTRDRHDTARSDSRCELVLYLWRTEPSVRSEIMLQLSHLQSSRCLLYSHGLSRPVPGDVGHRDALVSQTMPSATNNKTGRGETFNPLPRGCSRSSIRPSERPIAPPTFCSVPGPMNRDIYPELPAQRITVNGMLSEITVA